VGISFTIGPIPLSVKVGARGSVGVNFFFGLNSQPAFVTAQVIPNASVDAYAQAGIDIKIASAGVAVSLKLLHLTLTLGTQAGVQSDSKGSSQLLFVHGDSDLSLLDGNLAFFVEVYVPAFKLPPWEKKHFDHPFFNWTGFKKKGVLFNVEKHTPLSDAKAPSQTAAKTAAKAS
jgi:hypothetical protein